MDNETDNTSSAYTTAESELETLNATLLTLQGTLDAKNAEITAFAAEQALDDAANAGVQQQAAQMNHDMAVNREFMANEMFTTAQIA